MKPRPRRMLAAASAVVALATAAGAALAATGPAGAARPAGGTSAAGAERRGVESYAVPARASIAITGHGYGHGHGMSQYGAEGAARAGLGFRDIVSFYYPGTAWSQAGGRVRVLLTADTTDDVVVLARPGLVVRSVATKETWPAESAGATRWRLTAADGGRRTTVWAGTVGGWKRWRVVEGEAQLKAPGPIQLVTPSGTRAYRGALRSAGRPGSSARDTVNLVSLETYLRGVVPLEMPASWSPDAVRSQAVAARTYATAERAQPAAAHYDLCDTTSCQVYGGVAAEHPAATQAVRDTRSLALTYEGVPAFTQFSSSNGGWSSAGSVPYLVAQADPYDGWAGNPVASWSAQVGDDAVERAWPAIGDLRTIEVVERDGNGDWGGRVGAVRLVGTAGAVRVTGEEVRSALGLRSAWFTLGVSAGRNAGGGPVR